jgi:hypothetical protein
LIASQGKESVMRSLFACSLIVTLVACQALAEDQREHSATPLGDDCSGVLIRPSLPLLIVASYEGSISDALDEDALTEDEQKDFMLDFEATMAVKQAKIELLRAIHQLEAVEKKCKGTPAGDEAATLLKSLPNRKDLQPGQLATATAARKRTTVARHARVAPAEATTVK